MHSSYRISFGVWNRFFNSDRYSYPRCLWSNRIWSRVTTFYSSDCLARVRSERHPKHRFVMTNNVDAFVFIDQLSIPPRQPPQTGWGIVPICLPVECRQLILCKCETAGFYSWHCVFWYRTARFYYFYSRLGFTWSRIFMRFLTGDLQRLSHILQ